MPPALTPSIVRLPEAIEAAEPRFTVPELMLVLPDRFGLAAGSTSVPPVPPSVRPLEPVSTVSMLVKAVPLLLLKTMPSPPRLIWPPTKVLAAAPLPCDISRPLEMVNALGTLIVTAAPVMFSTNNAPTDRFEAAVTVYGPVLQLDDLDDVARAGGERAIAEDGNPVR